MKIHILYNFRKEPWGGGNQFLKALRASWKQQGLYSETLDDADVILMNSYPFRAEHFFDDIHRLKKEHPEKIIVYRLNGPVSHIRQKDFEVDRIIKSFNRLFVDGIIFQSDWCARENKNHFGIDSEFVTTIHNAPDKTIFFPTEDEKNSQKKTSLIATSWSANPRKGFDIYQYLDEHLNFEKYDMTFIGNSPVTFKNINLRGPVSSQELAPILRDHDIFIAASKTDPCSNSLIEALASGLPAVALKDGGHPELVGKGGELFEGMDDVIQTIDQVAEGHAAYKQQLPKFDIDQVSIEYYNFAKYIWTLAQNNGHQPKTPSVFAFNLMKSRVLAWKTKNKIQSIMKKLWKS